MTQPSQPPGCRRSALDEKQHRALHGKQYSAARYCVGDVGGERGDRARDLDAVARRDDVTPYEVYAEDIVWDLSNSGRELMLTKPVYQGHEGVRQFWREALSVFGEIDFEVEELIDAGDQVLAVIRERQVGRASGVPVETTHLAVWTLAVRQGHSDAGVRRPPARPRSRRAVGVGDVEGERREDQGAARTV